MKLKLLMIGALGAFSIHAFAQAALTIEGCDVLRVEVRTDRSTYVGSAVPVSVAGVGILVTADHVIPFELTPDRLRTLSITVTGGPSGLSTKAQVIRRDWASDLMVLSYGSRSDAKLVRSCPAAALRPEMKLKLVGFPATSGALVKRDAELIDPSDAAIRVSRAVNLIKVVAGAENGMSGGALLSERGEFVGLALQDWYSENQKLKGGAYVFPAPAVFEQLSRSLTQTGVGIGALDAVAPFYIDRDRVEMGVYGLRFRQVEVAAAGIGGGHPDGIAGGHPDGIAGGHPDGIAGGHPDGIGGTLPLTALEVVGFTGDPVPVAFQAMEKLIRRILVEGNGRIMVVRTEDGRSMRNLVELGRSALTDTAVPTLEFVIKQRPREAHSSEEDSVETLADKLVVQAFQFVQLDPGMDSVAQAARRAYTETKGGLSAQERAMNLCVVLRERDTDINRITERGAAGWRMLIDFNTIRVRLESKLHLAP